MAKDQLLFNYSSAQASEQRIRAEQERLKQVMDKFSSTVDGTKAWWVGDSRNSFVRQADEFSDLAKKINDIILYLAESLAEAGRVKKEEDERLQKELLDAIAVDPSWVADVEERSQARAEAQQTEDQVDDEAIQGNEKISFDDFKIIPDRPPYPDLEPVEIRIDPDSADLDDVIPPVIETDTKYVDPDNTADPDSIQMRDAWDDGNDPGSHVRTIFESRSDVEKVDWERTADGKSIITITFNDGKPPQVLVEGEDYYIKDDNAYLYNNVRTVLESSGAEIDYKKNSDGGSTITVTMPSGEVVTLVEGQDYEIGPDGKAHFLDETHGPLPPGATTSPNMKANTGSTNYNSNDYSNYNVVAGFSEAYCMKQGNYSKFISKVDGRNKGCTAVANAIVLSIARGYAVDPEKDVKWIDGVGCDWTGTKTCSSGTVKEEDGLKIIVDQLMQGNAVIVRASSHHSVAAVGIRSGADLSNLAAKDILVVDPADGKIKALSEVDDYKLTITRDWPLRIAS
jgi:uncharacterized protein YukE